MKLRKALIGLAIAVVCFVALWVVYIFWEPFRLTKLENRPTTYELDEPLKAEIERYILPDWPNDEDIPFYCVSWTTEILSFQCTNDIPAGKANCIGYAQLCAAISNYAFKIRHMNAKAKPVRGYVWFYDINVCNVLTSILPSKYHNFVKDHDFVEFTINGETTYTDPCLLDLIGKDCQTKINTK